MSTENTRNQYSLLANELDNNVTVTILTRGNFDLWQQSGEKHWSVCKTTPSCESCWSCWRFLVMGFRLPIFIFPSWCRTVGNFLFCSCQDVSTQYFMCVSKAKSIGVICSSPCSNLLTHKVLGVHFVTTFLHLRHLCIYGYLITEQVGWSSSTCLLLPFSSFPSRY